MLASDLDRNSFITGFVLAYNYAYPKQQGDRLSGLICYQSLQDPTLPIPKQAGKKDFRTPCDLPLITYSF
jgi:hypothetical protein